MAATATATTTTNTRTIETPGRRLAAPVKPPRLPSHAARRVTTALRGVDGRLAVVCG